MKTVKNTLILALGLLAATPFTKAEQYTPEYTDPMAFIKDFLNLNVKPKKPIKHWGVDVLGLTKDQPLLDEFRREIAAAVKMRNANRVGLAFFLNQFNFPPAMRDYIMNFEGGLKKIQEIIKKRMEVK
jgi:hypothetical protein